MNRRLALLAAATTLVCACSKAEPQPEEMSVRVVPSAKSRPRAGQSAPPAATVLGQEPTTKLQDHEIPTAEDYENEAGQRITADNLDDALDELEREIAN